MPEASLSDVLAARELRVQRQAEMLQKDKKPLVCFTLNIAGPVKISADTEYAFRVGSDRLLEGLKTVGLRVLSREDISSAAGYGLLLSVDGEAQRIKELCTCLEDLDDLGRLFDMDVIAEDGQKLSREKERCCLVCGQPGRGCASRRVHPVEQLQEATGRIICAHRIQAESERIASLAVQSLVDEVCVTPKPGLVDRYDSGSHRDMDVFTFSASAAALQPYFQKCYLAGARDRGLPPEEAFGRLRALGIEAERVMRKATAGVNTHKGIIFTMGVLCGAAGRIEGRDLEAWMDACAELTAGYRGPGVRMEAAEGLPSVRGVGLPALREGREKGLCFNDQCLLVLLRLLAAVEDTNMIARGGLLAASAARSQAKALIRFYEAGGAGSSLPDIMGRLNKEYIKKNLSPGGCADLLAATLLADRWTREQECDTITNSQDQERGFTC